MKIGDKVRFISEKGGGKIVAFRNKNIVVVEDSDGFEMPVLSSDVVVVESDDYDMAKVVSPKISGITEINGVKGENQQKEENVQHGEKEITFRPLSVERAGGDKLSVYIAFVPVDIKNFSTTQFECYFVNDSNYYIAYSYLAAEGNAWNVRHNAEIEPNTKELISTFGHEELNQFGKSAVQLIAYKQDRSFLIKPPVSVQFRIEPIKFYKLHVFSENNFFDVPAMICPIVENDIPFAPLHIDPESLIKGSGTHQDDMCVVAKTNAQNKKKANVDGSYVRRYDNGKHGGNPFIVKHRDDDNMIVVDLHAAELLDTTSGMSAADILNYQMKKFREVMAENLHYKGRKIVFIHGKGEGVLRRSIINDLSYRYKKCQYQDASFQEYGYGATQVTIR